MVFCFQWFTFVNDSTSAGLSSSFVISYLLFRTALTRTVTFSLHSMFMRQMKALHAFLSSVCPPFLSRRAHLVLTSLLIWWHYSVLLDPPCHVLGYVHFIEDSTTSSKCPGVRKFYILLFFPFPLVICCCHFFFLTPVRPQSKM